MWTRWRSDASAVQGHLPIGAWHEVFESDSPVVFELLITGHIYRLGIFDPGTLILNYAFLSHQILIRACRYGNVDHENRL